jgi:predicted exporter
MVKITQSRLLYSWLTITLICVSVLLYQSINHSIKFDANILTILDLGDNSGILTKAAREPFENKALLLFQLDATPESKTYLRLLKTDLSKQAGIDAVSFNPSDNLDIKQLISTYSSFPMVMLSDEAQVARDNDAYEYIIRRYMQLLSQPTNPLVTLSITQAPLLNVTDWFTARLEHPLWKQDEEFLYIDREGLHYYPLFIEFVPEAIQLDRVVPTIEELDQLLFQNSLTEPATVIKSGLAFHSAAVTEQIRFETQLFSALSLIGVLLLTLVSFRNLRPLVCILILIGASMLAGMTALVLVFEQIHLLSLVFAISLIGIAVDYGYHIMFAAKYTGLRGTLLAKHLAPALLMGAGTTLLSYLLLLLLPILLLQQVAVFVGAGIFFAVFTGLSVITWWSVKVTTMPPKVGSSVGPPRGFKLLLGLLVLGSVVAIPQWHFEDDINMFNSTPQHLIDNEILVSQLIGNQQYPRFISVVGIDQEQILQRFEQTRKVIQDLTDSAYELKGLDLWLPSIATQKNNARWLETGIEQQKLSPIVNMIEPEAIKNMLSTPDAWLTEIDLPQLVRKMYPAFVKQEGQLIGILSYMGPLEADLLTQIQAQLDFPLNYYDQPAQYSTALTKLRHYILYFLAMAVAALIMIMLVRYPIRVGLRLASLPILVAFSALAITQLIAGSVTIFNLLGCILILALNVDYIFFLREHGRLNYVLKSIFLSAATSALAFGIMVFSKTPAIWQFGLTVLVGVTLGWLLCYLLPSSLLNQGKNQV